jgi:hypothetical protein
MDLSARQNDVLPAVMCAIGSETTSLSNDELRAHVNTFLEALGEREDVLLLPPDFTRFNSRAGDITQMISEFYNFTKAKATRTDDDAPPPEKVAKMGSPEISILPTLGTHAKMTQSEIRKMYGDALADREPTPFVVHNWRSDVVTIGEAPASMVEEATGGMVTDTPWPAQLNKLIWEKRKALNDPSKQKYPSLVLSIGQVVPHEVMGMANYNKNLFVGAVRRGFVALVFCAIDAVQVSNF